MPRVNGEQVGVAFDMRGCPNRCRHCYLGAGDSSSLLEKDVRWGVSQFRDFIAGGNAPVKNLAVADGEVGPCLVPLVVHAGAVAQHVVGVFEIEALAVRPRAVDLVLDAVGCTGNPKTCLRGLVSEAVSFHDGSQARGATRRLAVPQRRTSPLIAPTTIASDLARSTPTSAIYLVLSYR